MSDSGSDTDALTPPAISEAAVKIKSNLLPEVSRRRYERCYQEFMKWRTAKNTTSFSENVLIAYFDDLSDKRKSSTLWTTHSMLKSTLSIKHDVDITSYLKLLAILRRKAVGYEGKQSKTFCPDEIKMFLSEAPDEIYLLTKLEQDLLNYETWIESKVTRPRLKPQVPQNLRNVNSYPTLPSTSVADVDPFLNIQEKGVRCMPECSNIQVALIFGILGACRQHELYSLLLKHVQVFKSMILVKIYNAKSKTYRSFTVTGPHYELCKRYIELRPKSCKIPTFFLNYRSGRCTESKLGKNKFGTLCKTMASFLRLPNPELYTSQCFRRTSVTLSVNNDGDIKATKRQYGWQSVAKYSMMPHDDAGNGDENINDVAKTIGESDIELSEEETNSDKSDTTDPIEIPKTKKLLTAKRISDKKIDTGPNKKPRQDIDDFIIDYDNIDKFGEQIAFLLKRIPRQLCRELQDSIVTLVKTATDKHESKTKVDATPSTSSCTKVNSIISQNVLTRTLVTKTNLNEDITIKEEFNDDSTVDAATQVMQLEQQPGTSTIETFPKPMTIPFELVGSFDCVKQEVLDPGDSSDITVQEQNKDGTTLVKKFSEPNDTLVKIELEENDLNSELKKRMDSND